MFEITNEALLNSIAGGDDDSPDDSGSGSDGSNKNVLSPTGSGGGASDSSASGSSPSTSSSPDLSAAQVAACVVALSKAEASPTLPNVFAASVTCAPVLANIISPTNIGNDQQKSDSATPYKANQG